VGVAGGGREVCLENLGQQVWGQSEWGDVGRCEMVGGCVRKLIGANLFGTDQYHTTSVPYQWYEVPQQGCTALGPRLGYL